METKKRNLLVSDFDNTYYLGDILTYYNNHKIKEFIEKENIFAFATLRSYKIMRQKIKQLNLIFNYLSLCNGSVLLDNNLNLLFEQLISDDIVLKILNILKNYKGHVSTDLVDSKDEITENDCVRISIRVWNPIVKSDILKELKSIEGIQIKTDFFHNIFLIHVLNGSANKANNVRLIADIEKIDKENIFTVGDSKDDLKMIETFTGFSSILGNLSCRKASQKTILSVGKLAEDIEKGFVRKRKF